MSNLTRNQAFALVTSWTKNSQLVKHMLAVEAQMRALARHFHQDEDLWGLAGLLHDADYEMFKDDPLKHPSQIFPELERLGADPRLIQAIRAHAWGHQPDAPQPQNQLDWSLYCSDDLSGFIIACALVRPDKKLASVTLDSLLKKWPQKAFAAGVKRDHVELCQDKLNLKLKDFILICLQALQAISPTLGL